ncbi:MAG TPA: hypothetical protein PLR20_10000 [Syntrophales bacterium]|nr:hypothetical protein [Syntrophales bacterium]HOX93211.1 hypothetical protein [Syntrophales bacterium]HPI57610.1 hypothetical protein [Syntrophales bacterium]HPN25377.1 hypothetical protein [Syntrophales bacterium]HQM29669.1 hypothetical protein [Syntrophales bacterium]
MAVRGIVIGIALFFAISTAMPVAVAAEDGQEQENIGDVDPTKPVIFNIREEFYKINGDTWKNAFILRTDIIRLGGLRNFLLRFDVPFMSTEMGQVRDDGLGDLYGQALLIPYASEKFFFAVGTGLTAPSATEDTLGSGKWQVSPLAVPGLRFKDPRGLFFVKVQDYISFAGQDDRADIHYMTVQPFLIMKLSDKWWAGADSEAKINWEQDNRKSYKSGVILLRMWTKSFGTWVKPEFPWGSNREGDWNLKASFFWNY